MLFCFVCVSVSELPKHAPYLVIGAGTAAYAAYRAIRAADATAKVCVHNAELSVMSHFSNYRPQTDTCHCEHFAGCTTRQ